MRKDIMVFICYYFFIFLYIIIIVLERIYTLQIKNKKIRIY